MRRYIWLILMVGLILLVAIVLRFGSPSVESTGTEQTSCSELGPRQVDEEKSLGIILANSLVLTVRLDGENNYSPPGGHIERDETKQQALIREMREEIGLTVEEGQLREYITNCRVKDNQVIRSHFFFVDDVPEDINYPSDSTKLKWVDYNYVNSKRASDELTKILFFLKRDKFVN